MADEFDFFDTVIETGSKALNWLEENPKAADFITGATVATMSYLSAEEDRKLIREEREERKKYGGASTISPGESGYALSLTNGALAPKQGGPLV